MNLAYDPTSPDSVLLARHRYATIRHTIPERLDTAARVLREAIECARSYHLDCALELGPDLYDIVAAGLMQATQRIRDAAEDIGVPSAVPENVCERDPWGR